MFDDLLRNIEEGTNQERSATGRSFPTHPRKACSHISTQEAQPKCFDLIVGMMRQRDNAHTEANGGLTQEFQAQNAPGHFDGNSLLARRRGDIASSSMKPESES